MSQAYDDVRCFHSRNTLDGAICACVTDRSLARANSLSIVRAYMWIIKEFLSCTERWIMKKNCSFLVVNKM